jgi:hypothetical protein
VHAGGGERPLRGHPLAATEVCTCGLTMTAGTAFARRALLAPKRAGRLAPCRSPLAFLLKWTNETRRQSQARPCIFCALVPGLSASAATFAATRPVYGEPHPSQRRGLHLVGANLALVALCQRRSHHIGGTKRFLSLSRAGAVPFRPSVVPATCSTPYQRGLFAA